MDGVIATTLYLFNRTKLTATLYFLRGNHDDLCCRWLRNLTQEWVQHGQSTMDATNVRALNREAHLKFLNRLDNFYIDNQNRLLIHAGFQNI